MSATTDPLSQSLAALRAMSADLDALQARCQAAIHDLKRHLPAAARVCADCGRPVDETDSRLDACEPPHRLCRACDRWSKRDPQPTPQHMRCEICRCWVRPEVLGDLSGWDACPLCLRDAAALSLPPRSADDADHYDVTALVRPAPARTTGWPSCDGCRQPADPATARYSGSRLLCGACLEGAA